MLFTGPVTVNVTMSAHELRRALRRELQPLKELLMSQFTDLRDELAGVFADLAAKIQRLQDAVDNPSSETHLSAEDQATFDSIKAAVDSARASVGDEDGSDVPPTDPTDPTDPPVDPTTV